MDLPDILLIAVGLSLDCFAVSLAGGTTVRSGRLRVAAAAGLVFGLFQAGMAIIGWAAGTGLEMLIGQYGPGIAFLLLTGVGVKMIAEARNGADVGGVNLAAFLPLLVLSFTTSIDALAAGISFAVLSMDVFFAAAVIGLVAAAFSIAGVFLGARLAGLPGRRAEVAGGLILIAIGVRILAEGYL